MKFGVAQAVQRFIEQRKEPRIELDPATNHACLVLRGESHEVHLGNISDSGVMFLFDKQINIGERVAMKIGSGKTRPAQVMWVRSGQVGLSFAHPAQY